MVPLKWFSSVISVHEDEILPYQWILDVAKSCYICLHIFMKRNDTNVWRIIRLETDRRAGQEHIFESSYWHTLDWYYNYTTDKGQPKKQKSTL